MLIIGMGIGLSPVVASIKVVYKAIVAKHHPLGIVSAHLYSKCTFAIAPATIATQTTPTRCNILIGSCQNVLDQELPALMVLKV